MKKTKAMEKAKAIETLYELLAFWKSDMEGTEEYKKSRRKIEGAVSFINAELNKK